PLAYIQSYIACLCSEGWWEDITDPATVGIDFFIGEAGKLNHGLGTALLQAFARKLFSNPSVNRIISDPSPENPRSIAALQKAGFTRLGDISTPDGAAVLLELKRSAATSNVL
ncbi:MAG TPA: GNAT family N-acetyltransferase, partial [Candidatus Obscuribacter sp.]|nr:GNAT family N-acetyltransferase [Candidatus Obscuribacter sp.]